LIGSGFTVQDCKGIVPQFIAACFQTVATTCPPSASPSGGAAGHSMGEMICIAGYPITPCKLGG